MIITANCTAVLCSKLCCYAVVFIVITSCGAKAQQTPPPCCASRHRAVSPNWPKIEWHHPTVTPHLPWKFHANWSCRFLLILLTKKPRKKERYKQRNKERKKLIENNNDGIWLLGGGFVNRSKSNAWRGGGWVVPRSQSFSAAPWLYTQL